MNQMSGKGGGVHPPAAEEKSGGMAAWEKYEEQERLRRGYSESYFFRDEAPPQSAKDQRLYPSGRRSDGGQPRQFPSEGARRL